MKISIAGWESKNLRCPDMKIEIDKDNINPICLVQMPNGTGKSTIESLINAALSHKKNFQSDLSHEKEIINLRKLGSKDLNGFFELILFLENDNIY